MTASMPPVPDFIMPISTRLLGGSRRLACAALLATVMCGVAGAVRAEVRVGAVEQAQGGATAAQTGHPARTLAAGAEILSNDTLITSSDGRLAARLEDDTRLTLGE